MCALFFFFFFCSCKARSRSVSFFLPCTKAGCLKGNSLPLWQALNQLFAGLRGGRGTFTQPFSPGCRSPSLPIKSHFLHSMHEARPRRHTRYCGCRPRSQCHFQPRVAHSLGDRKDFCCTGTQSETLTSRKRASGEKRK